ncbi:hypothetical protein AMECASPLE_025534 [Ameca splendens]|uniref:Uncharacterized protein n=1 Tax=Ameca splendens TaxID=208324 RepID=A0ABV0Y4W5_9TELE
MVEVDKGSQSFQFYSYPPSALYCTRLQLSTIISISSIPFGGAPSKLTVLRFEARPTATTSKAQILLSLLCVAGTVHLSVILARSAQADLHLLLYSSLSHLSG